MNRTKAVRALGMGAALAMALLASMPGAWALTKCKAKLGKKTGTVYVNAQNVDGTLRWGWSPGMVAFDFDNAGTCISGAAAKKCTLGAAGTPERITPPPMCTLYLEDDTTSCSSFIPGCTPGGRPMCPPDTEQVGSWCIDRAATSAMEFSDAVATCQAKGRSVCPLEALIECDTNRAGGSYPAQSCAGFTDGTGWLWTTTPDASDGVNFFSVMTVYQSDNEANVQSTAVGSFYNAFCCSRLGGQ